VDLVLEGKVVARGELVAVDGFFAVRITELPLPLRL
jgi:flagellar motor switch protein FliN/FliY